MATIRTPERDASLRHVQRDSVVICAVAALAALALMGGRPEGALGVLAGGAMMAVSYLAIKGGVDAIVSRSLPASERPLDATARKRAIAWAITKFIGRYALIGVAAWAVLVPLRAHPLGVFAGVTAPVLAIGIEAARLMRAPRGPR